MSESEEQAGQGRHVGGKRRLARPDWKPIFLRALGEQHVTVSEACKAAGVSRRTPYDARERDAVFAEEWDAVVEASTEVLEREAVRRAGEGTVRPVFQQGRKVGEVREFSDQLLMFLLRSRRPEVYRDSSTVRHEGDGARVEVNVTLDAGQREQLRGLLRSRPVRFDGEAGVVTPELGSGDAPAA